MVRMLSGHDGLGSHLVKFRQANIATCRFCGLESEDFVHLVFRCTSLRECWLEVGRDLGLEVDEAQIESLFLDSRAMQAVEERIKLLLRI